MASPAKKLALLPYLQRWDGSSLHLRVLLSPRDAMIEPFVGQPPPWPSAFFPAASLKFNVKFLAGLEDMPGPGDGIDLGQVTFNAMGSAQTIFAGLKKQFEIDLAPPAPQSLGRVRKHLPLSYQDASGYAPTDSDLFTTDNTYSCYLKQRNPAYKYTEMKLPPKYLPSWGKLIASMLRIPRFAEQAGLIRDCTIAVDPELLKRGGFLFFALDPITASQIQVSPGEYVTYSTRIAELDSARDLFSPVFFPLLDAQGGSAAAGRSEIFAEVDEYADGWAKTVHCIQPQQLSPIKEEPDGTRPVKDLGVRVGWDDEQVTKWLDRQLSAGPDFYCPLGVHGYRIDVREADTDRWHCLTQGKGNFGKGLGAGNSWLGDFESELAVEIHPVQSMDGTTSNFWMPMYFTNWTGSSLVGLDKLSLQTLGLENPTSESQISGIDPGIELRYGRSYQFRVRLMDHTGGGPTLASNTSSLGPNPISKSLRFRRWIRPLAPTIVDDIPVLGEWPDSECAPLKIEVKRPQLSWPSIAFTGAYPDVLAQLDKIEQQNHINFSNNEDRPETALPDPDANEIEIAVWVETLPQDSRATNGTYALLYTTKRRMPLDYFASLSIMLDWQYCRDVWDPEKDGVQWYAEANDGAIILPKARLLRLRIRILCSTRQNITSAAYFGADDVQAGPEVTIPLRKNATSEAPLYVDLTQSELISAYFLQRSAESTNNGQRTPVIGETTARLATELQLRSVGTALRGKPGNRVVFGCSGALRHVLGPDRASISFPSDTDLIRQWIVVIRLIIERDWTWNGLKAGGIVVKRKDLNNKEIINFSPTYSAGHDAIAGAQTDRSRTYLVIIDAIDPKPVGGDNPTMLDPLYSIETSLLVASSPPVIECGLRLPVATSPIQTPKIVSVGLAMSPYSPDPTGYAYTSARKRMVWVEFAEPLHDNQDRYFARVLASAPDPLLAGSSQLTPETVEPELPIDSEVARRIVPKQANDNSGLTAMQPMIPSSSPVHWGLPLPQGLDENSSELFGFFTYEFRVGHYNDHDLDRWSTAQARFGAQVRISGVQHPYPPLTCTAFRSWKGIDVSAPYAQVAPARSAVPRTSTTHMCFLLYAQAVQIDGGGQRRNILLDYKYVRARRPATDTVESPPAPRLVASGFFEYSAIFGRLIYLGFKGKTPLSVLAVEMENQLNGPEDPLGANLGEQRILRTSNLVAIAPSC